MSSSAAARLAVRRFAPHTLSPLSVSRSIQPVPWHWLADSAELTCRPSSSPDASYTLTTQRSVSPLGLARSISPCPSLRSQQHHRSLSLLSRFKAALPSGPLSSSSASTSASSPSAGNSSPAEFDDRLAQLVGARASPPSSSSTTPQADALPLFREMLAGEDSPAKESNARKIVDNWEKIGGWVSGPLLACSFA